MKSYFVYVLSINAGQRSGKASELKRTSQSKQSVWSLNVEPPWDGTIWHPELPPLLLSPVDVVGLDSCIVM